MVCKTFKEQGANAVKFLLYYDVDDAEEINIQKHISKESVQNVAEDIPFFLEVLTYDDNIPDNGSVEFAKVKPRKVNEAMKLFSEPRFNVDVLKVEVPVNMKYVKDLQKVKWFIRKKQHNTLKIKMLQQIYHIFT